MMMAEDTIITTCANCGKGEESSGDIKACTACHMVKYCNRECQIAHRPLHKKACKKRAAVLHDEALFKEHPPREECPICFLPLPFDTGQTTFSSCCGKVICAGCIIAMAEEACGRGIISLCAFCRVPMATSDKEIIKQLQNLIEAKNAYAFYDLAGYYVRGVMGMPQDIAKANELYLKAGELGCARAYNELGFAYYNGRGVEVDKKKAKHYLELAAIKGDVRARHNLGRMEGNVGNYDRAYKHFILSAMAGDSDSLEAVKEGFMQGLVTKDEYANTLRAHQEQYDELKSDTRTTARAVSSRYSKDLM